MLTRKIILQTYSSHITNTVLRRLALIASETLMLSMVSLHSLHNFISVPQYALYREILACVDLFYLPLKASTTFLFLVPSFVLSLCPNGPR